MSNELIINRENNRTESSEDDLYQVLPRFVTQKFDYLRGYLLKPVFQKFEWKGEVHQLLIVPAFAEDDDGQTKNFFPGSQERAVEAALIQLAVEDKNAFFDGNKIFVFTLEQLQKCLAASGQDLNRRQIKRSLQILVSAHFTLMVGEYRLLFRLIDALAIVEEEDDMQFTAYLGDLIAGEIKRYKPGI